MYNDVESHFLQAVNHVIESLRSIVINIMWSQARESKKSEKCNHEADVLVLNNASYLILISLETR